MESGDGGGGGVRVLGRSWWLSVWFFGFVRWRKGNSTGVVVARSGRKEYKFIGCQYSGVNARTAAPPQQLLKPQLRNNLKGKEVTIQ